VDAIEEAVMTAADQAQIPPQTTWRDEVLLWFGVLGPPGAWLVHFNLGYLLTWHACATHSALWLHVNSAGCLALTGMALLAAWQTMGQPSGGDIEFEQRHSRRRFMGMLGVLNSVMFALVIIAQTIATVLVVPCPD
jgi:hypothetical protein